MINICKFSSTYFLQLEIRVSCTKIFFAVLRLLIEALILVLKIDHYQLTRGFFTTIIDTKGDLMQKDHYLLDEGC